jgi:hypothetical protein
VTAAVLDADWQTLTPAELAAAPRRRKPLWMVFIPLPPHRVSYPAEDQANSAAVTGCPESTREGNADACQRALGVQGNVVVEARTCGVPSINVMPGTSNPDWATRDAERVAKAMLDSGGTDGRSEVSR